MSHDGGILAGALLEFRRRLDPLASRHGKGRNLVEGAVNLYGVSRATFYSALAGQL